jgi:tetratricopeptide (TPR) repeat protein
LPKSNTAVATSVNNLAELYRAQGRLAEAEPLLQRALALSEQALPEGHPDIATNLNNLADLYLAGIPRLPAPERRSCVGRPHEASV